MMKAAFFGNSMPNIDRVYAFGRKEKVAELFDVYPTVINAENIDQEIASLADIEYIFCTWGMFNLEEKYLDQLPKLKAVFYAAGSVKHFAEAFLKRGILVISAADANGEFVACYAASQIQLAATGFFHNLRVDCYNARAFHGKRNESYTGLFAIRVGLIGAGMIGRRTIEKLRLPDIEICVYDPFLSEEEAKALNVTKVSLEEMFATCQVVSNHAPNIPSTYGMLKPEHFESMLPMSTFINTGRGRTIDEEGMLQVLKKRTDIVAILDVTYPEPPAEDSLIFHLPNVYHTSHIAGALGREVVHMADLCLDEAHRLLNGEPLQYNVTLERLPFLA